MSTTMGAELRAAMRARRAVTLLLAAGLLATTSDHAAAAPAGDAGAMQVTSVDTSAAPDVAVEISVPALAASGPLAAGAFSVTADGQPVQLAVEQVPASGLEVVLVFDTSGSMNEGGALGAAKDAARRFLTTLPAEAQVGVISFADRPALVSPLSADRALLDAAIGALGASGETALHDALVFAPSLFSGGTDDRQIVLLSDGGDTVSLATLDEALLGLAGIRTSVIELVSSEANQLALQQVASATGGTLSSVGDPAALDGLFQRVAETLIHRYRLSFTAPGAGTTELVIRAATPSGPLEARQAVELPGPSPEPASAAAGPEPVASTLPAVTPVAAGERAPAARADADRGPGRILLVAGAAACFAALLLLAFAVLPVDRGRRPNQLLAGPSTASRILPARPTASGLADRVTDAADRMLERGDRRRGLAAALDVAGIALRPGEFVVISGVGALVLSLVLAASVGPIGPLVAVVLTAIGARLVVSMKAGRRRRQFTDQLPEVLQLMVSALRAGYALPQALDAAASQSAEPARAELQRVLLEVRVGRDPADALGAAADRMRSRDFSWVVSAIQINREIGGELAGILEKVAETIRERQRMARQVATLTAEGRLSAYVLTALPIGLAVVLSITNPGYFDPFRTSPGPALVVIGAVLLVVGWIWMRRLVRAQL